MTQIAPDIRQLDEAAVNRIAAGEVIERPANAVKELVENALDAGATRVRIDIANGGKSLIRISDDGHGIAPKSLPLAITRHATSKIDGSDLTNIHSFGFRGEALASLGAVGRLTVTSRAIGAEQAFEIAASGGIITPQKPAALSKGTVVTLRDLFYATPARLKFMRTDRAEMQAVSDVIKRLAMAEPFVGFMLRDVTDGKERDLFSVQARTGDLFDALHGRLADVLGKDFAQNALPIDVSREGISLKGYAALPTYSRGAAVAQYLFVNGRPVKDRLLLGALRAAYFDFLSRDRHPVAALFINCAPELVDVNVHPAKSEVRFRDPAAVRGLLVSSLRHALANAGHRASTTVADATLSALKPEQPNPRVYQMDRPSLEARNISYQMQAPSLEMPGMSEPTARFDHDSDTHVLEPQSTPVEHNPLGAARAQVHENYIIAQTQNGLVIVDGHAAHERLVYEKLKRQMADTGVASQALLIPEIIDLPAGDTERLLALELERFGLVIEAFGSGAIAVRETPAILGTLDVKGLVQDILDELDDTEDSLQVQARIEAVLSRMACHGSIRTGRRMRPDEMNALLREMEATPHSGQCNHGRPTYVELKLTDIERLFGRT